MGQHQQQNRMGMPGQMYNQQMGQQMPTQQPTNQQQIVQMQQIQ
jgi:hypothetical protein